MSGYRSERIAAIKAILTQVTHPLTTHAIGAATGLDQTTIYETLTHMEMRKQVRKHPTKAQRGRRGALHYEYELT